MKKCLAIAIICVGCGCRANSGVQLVSLGDSLEPFRTQFNADRDRLRVVALFSPV